MTFPAVAGVLGPKNEKPFSAGDANQLPDHATEVGQVFQDVPGTDSGESMAGKGEFFTQGRQTSLSPFYRAAGVSNEIPITNDFTRAGVNPPDVVAAPQSLINEITDTAPQIQDRRGRIVTQVLLQDLCKLIPAGVALAKLFRIEKVVAAEFCAVQSNLFLISVYKCCQPFYLGQKPMK